jgi:hypothetical protein
VGLFFSTTVWPGKFNPQSTITRVRGDMVGTGTLFLGDIFLGRCAQKTKDKLIMVTLERRNFNKNGVTNALSYSCSTFSSG